MEKDIQYLLSNDIQRFVNSEIESGFLYRIGWANSFYKKVSVDKDNNPLPWVSYSMIHFLEKHLKKDMTIFEFGSGNSTLFLSKLVKKVVSVEHDKKWFDLISSKISDNVVLVYQELEYDSEYCKTAQKYGEFDVIIVDGRDRINCVINSIESLKPSGVIIFDDSYRQKYEPAFSILEEKGFKSLSFEGISPGCMLNHQSTIFYKEENVFNI